MSWAVYFQSISHCGTQLALYWTWSDIKWSGHSFSWCKSDQLKDQWNDTSGLSFWVLPSSPCFSCLAQDGRMSCCALWWIRRFQTWHFLTLSAEVMSRTKRFYSAQCSSWRWFAGLSRMAAMSDSRGIYSGKPSAREKNFSLEDTWSIPATHYTPSDSFLASRQLPTQGLHTQYWNVIRYSWLIIFLFLCFSSPFHFLPAEAHGGLI